MDRIPVSGPSITQKEIDYVTEAVSTAWYGNANVFHEKFERAFCQFLGRKYCVALPSCTSAIHLALLALGIGPGDEVVVPDVTWIASAAPISYVGATPVFADIDSKTWCITPESLEQCITKNTKAVIPVDLYGGMPDMTALLQICHKHQIALIEDAAEAIGSEYHGKKAGSFGLASTFSFHGSKTLTTGEGGLLATDDEKFFQRVQVLRDHGRTPGDKMFFNAEVAYKYKMSSMQAALGLAQLERIDELVSKKREIFSWYKENLEKIPYVTLNYEPPNTVNTYWMVTLVLDKKLNFDKRRLMEELGSQGIDSRPFFYPLSALPAYSTSPNTPNARDKNKVAYKISPYGINLPSGLNLTKDMVERVCNVIRNLL